MALTGQVDMQLPRILDRRRMAVEEPIKYGSMPLLTARPSCATSCSKTNNISTAKPPSPQAVTSNWKLELETLKMKAGMKLNLDELRQESMEESVSDTCHSPISSSHCSSEDYSETPRLFCIDDDSENGDNEEAPGASRVPRLPLAAPDEEFLPCRLFPDHEELDGLVAKHEEREVAAGVKVLRAGKPTLSTHLLAAAEDARRWLLSHPSLEGAMESATNLAAQRAPQAASDVARAASQWLLKELRESRVAVEAFSKPEALLLEAPAPQCPHSPRDALECLTTALQRGRPTVTIRAVASAEQVRQHVLCAWSIAEQLGRDIFTSRAACSLAQTMQHCAAIADVYEHKNLRVLSDEQPLEN